MQARFFALRYRLLQYIEELPRSRIWLFLLFALVVTAAAGQGLLILTGFHDSQPYQQKIVHYQQQITANNTEIANLIERHNNSENRGLEQRKTQLLGQLSQIHQRIDETRNFLIPPDQMPKVLQNLLARHPGMELWSIQSLPVEQLNQNSSQTSVYSHSLVLKIKSSFLNMSVWLNEIERLSWVLNWDYLKYRIDEWPNGVFELKIHTLSDQEVWLDV